MDIDALVQSQAKQAGMSAKQAKQALKKLREGGMMAQLAPLLQEKLSGMNPNLTPREKLRAKLNNARMGRTTKEVKTANYEKEREEVHQREEKRAEEKEKAKEAAVRRKKAHQQKIKELEKKLGRVSNEMYLDCLSRQKANTYRDEGERNRDRNIIELYGKQQEFKESISVNDLDELMSSSEEDED
jgi:hypothetical protein